MNGILLLGGHSDIGGDLLTRLCAGRPVVLAARRAWTLTEVAERASAAGATEVMGLTEQDYGSLDFAIQDPEGVLWSVGSYRGAGAD